MISERIKKVRKALDLTQQEFADQLNIKRNTVATYEVGKSNPSDAAVILICKTFNVSETWLRTGEGKMFVELSRDEALAAQITSFLQGGSDTFRQRLVSLLLRLTPEQWEALEGYALELIGSRPPTSTVEQDADKVADVAREQFLSQKKPESPALSSNASAGG